jgi:hypothetical protein
MIKAKKAMAHGQLHPTGQNPGLSILFLEMAVCVNGIFFVTE